MIFVASYGKHTLTYASTSIIVYDLPSYNEYTYCLCHIFSSGNVYACYLPVVSYYYAMFCSALFHFGVLCVVGPCALRTHLFVYIIISIRCYTILALNMNKPCQPLPHSPYTSSSANLIRTFVFLHIMLIRENTSKLMCASIEIWDASTN